MARGFCWASPSVSEGLPTRPSAGGAEIGPGRRRACRALLAAATAAGVPAPSPGRARTAAESAAGQPAAPDCAALRFGATLLQPTRELAGKKPQEWLEAFHALRRTGIEEVVLQWTSFGDLDFYAGRPGAREAMPVLPHLARAARDAGLRLWVGLHHDQLWWNLAQRSAEERGAYLARRLADLQARVPALRQALGDLPQAAFAGWYIPDEIDDGTWAAPAFEAVLVRYLGATRRLLAHDHPRRPVAVSAFANGAQTAEGYAAQWRRVAEAGGIGRLLLQDGIGAGKRTAAEARGTAAAIARALRGSQVQFGVITEFFDMRAASPSTAGDSSTVPAKLDEIVRRASSTAGIGSVPPVSFSHIHHLSPFGGAEAEQRGKEWAALLQRCRGRA